MIGKTISHYKIIEKLGAGGMGVVYKAQDLKLDRFVALKFLPLHLTTSENEKQRFIHEAKATSSLDHNNICAIHEIGETEEGQLYIVMAYYKGETLEKRIREKPLPIEEAIDIAVQIANGLAQAHEKEIVHRDIKPANIMLTNNGVVKILDFGLAKLSTQTQLTKEGTTLGTISYMSPEQTRGDKVDARSDIWSLGVIMYEMITGQSPFKGDYDQAVIYAILNESPEPITGLRTGVPLELERVINRCISKNRQDRYQHIDDLRSELNRLKKESSEIRTKKVVYKKPRRSITILIVITSILLLLIADYVFLIPDGSKDEITKSSGWENSIAVLPFANISNDPEQEYFCDGMTEQIITNLGKIKRLKVIARTSVMTYKNTNKQIPEIGKELNVANILEGSVRKYGNSIRVTAQLINTEDGSHLWAEDFDRELEHVFRVQDDVSQAIASNLLSTLSVEEISDIQTDRPKNIENYERYIQAHGFHLKFLQTQNQDYLDDAIRLLNEILKREPDYLSAQLELADVYNTYYNFIARSEEEKSKYDKLQTMHIDIAYHLNPHAKDVLMVKEIIAFSYTDADFLSEIYLNSLIKRLSIDPNEPYSNWQLGSWFRQLGLEHKSLYYLNKAVEIDPLFSTFRTGRAFSYANLGEYEKAETDFKKAYEIESQDYDNNNAYIRFLIANRKVRQAENLISQWQTEKPDDRRLLALNAKLSAIKGDEKKAFSIYNQITFLDKADALVEMAKIYLLLNKNEKAIETLIEFENKRSAGIINPSDYFKYLNLPYYKPLHNDPRFLEILSKHKELYEQNLSKYGDLAI